MLQCNKNRLTWGLREVGNGMMSGSDKDVVKVQRLSVPEVLSMKGGAVIVCITSYTSPMASLLDGYADILLVGDSVGMVIYGMDNTLGVTMDMMVNHARAVVLGSVKSCVVVDMPYGSFESSLSDAFKSAARLLAESGAQAVKLEGGEEMAETISYLCRRGIPVMGHVGLMPQRVNAYGGFYRQGGDSETRVAIKRDALAVEDAGAFAVVLESIDSDLADDITGSLSIPTIGIGASIGCDGQVLVCDDLLGLGSNFPGFVKSYADLNSVIEDAVKRFCSDVRKRLV